MGWQRPQPTTRKSGVIVLVTAIIRNWSTHIITPTSCLAIVGFMLLLVLRCIRVAEMQVFVWRVDEMGGMIGLVCALGSRRVVCWVVRRVGVIGVVVYWSTRGRGKVVRLGEVPRVVRMGSGRRGTIIGAVGASGIGRILLAW
jgi:hypothetical protein